MTKNFSRVELECNCGCGAYIEDEVFLYNLQRLREMYGKPMILSSAKRCARYNAIVSKTGENGPHVKHGAVDVLCYGDDYVRLIWLAHSVGFQGLGSNQKGDYRQRFLHLDRRVKPWGWCY